MNVLAKIGLWGLLIGSFGTALHADPPGGWLSPSGVSGSTGTPEPSPPQAGASANLSLVDLQARVNTLREQTRNDARHIQHMQAVARREKDIIKLNCVNDKLVQLKPQMNMVDSAAAEIGSSREEGRTLAFESVTQAAENIRRLREEADQCIGEPITTGGESSNSFTGPGATDDPAKGFGHPPIEPPGYASPFN
jgi:hypothetical protein